MRVFALIKILVCVTLIVVTAYFGYISRIRDMNMALVLIGYFTLELLPGIIYLRAYQKAKRNSLSDILDKPENDPLRMSLWYKIISIVLSAITIFAVCNLMLVYSHQRVVLQQSHISGSEIFRQSTLPAICVLSVALLLVCFNFISSFSKIKTHGQA